MAIAPPVSAQLSKHLPGRRFDHLFFTGMILLLIAIVFLGFAHSYYLAGIFHAPLKSPILQIHGAAYSCWMLLLLTQTALVSARRIDLHRRLGIAGFVLACLVVVLGVLAVANQLTRFAYAKDAILTFTAPEFAELFNFAVLAGLAFALRRKAAAHKRLVLLATIGLMGAALARWLYVIYLLLGLIAIYDLWATHRIHPATIWGSAQIVLTMWAARLLGPTEAWHVFARWVQSWGL